MTPATTILLGLWRLYQNSHTSERKYASGVVDAFETAVNVLFLTQARDIIEELENDLITHSPHAQPLADYIRKVKPI